MNSAAPSFTGMIQDCLWQDVILHIARLTDKAKTAGRENLSLLRLCEEVKVEELKASLSGLISQSEATWEFSRDWRNRHIAHRDLELSLNGAVPLKPASRKKVKDALEAIARVMNTVSKYYFDSETIFSSPTMKVNGAISLLYVIDRGLEAEKNRRDRVAAGNLTSDDLKHRDI